MLRLACHSRQAPCARNSRPASEPSDRLGLQRCHTKDGLSNHISRHASRGPLQPAPGRGPLAVRCITRACFAKLARQGPVCAEASLRERRNTAMRRVRCRHTHTRVSMQPSGARPTLELPSAQYRPPPLGRLRGSFPWHGRAWPTRQREKTVLAATCAVQPATTPASSRLLHELRFDSAPI